MNESETIQPVTQFTVLLIGDSCVDEYKMGLVDRLSPEAPVPVIKIIETFSVPGMAANVCNNLLSLNLNVDFITNNERIVKTRFIDKRSGQHIVRVDLEPTVVPWDKKFPRNIKKYDAIVISDYNKGFLSSKDIENIIFMTDNPVFIDTKKQDLSKFSRFNSYIKINEVEYNNSVSIPENLIVTLGSKGAMLKQKYNESVFPTNAASVVDVCGCGDTFLSAVVFQFLQTKNISDAIIFANKAASITVGKQGNYSPKLQEIYDRY